MSTNPTSFEWTEPRDQRERDLLAAYASAERELGELRRSLKHWDQQAALAQEGYMTDQQGNIRPISGEEDYDFQEWLIRHANWSIDDTVDKLHGATATCQLAYERLACHRDLRTILLCLRRASRDTLPMVLKIEILRFLFPSRISHRRKQLQA